MLTTIKTKLLRFIHKSVYKPGHFYSTVPSSSDIDRRKNSPDSKEVPAIDLREEAQRTLLNEFASYKPKFIWEKDKKEGLRYYTGNTFFTQFDGYILFSMIQRYKPKRIVEIGSGFSSALMLDVNDRYMDRAMELTFIDPFMDRLDQLLSAEDKQSGRVRKIASMIQDVDLSLFEQLEAGDILFIDSSHVSKVGSDVNFEVFQILPRLKPGVVVHFHDICFPFEYPSSWFDMGIYWNEAYLLRAFLMYNNQFSILMYNHFWKDTVVPDYGTVIEGGSLWLVKN